VSWAERRQSWLRDEPKVIVTPVDRDVRKHDEAHDEENDRDRPPLACPSEDPPRPAFRLASAWRNENADPRTRAAGVRVATDLDRAGSGQLDGSEAPPRLPLSAVVTSGSHNPSIIRRCGPCVKTLKSTLRQAD